MSLLSELKPLKGSRKVGVRRGRGRGSNAGGTSGKGHKGQRARSGFSLRRGFEGGQMPLYRRLPKFGFNNKNFRTFFEFVNLGTLEKHFDGKQEVTPESLKEKGLVQNTAQVKVLAKGKLTKPLQIKVHKVSASAKKSIESAGGKVEVIS